MIRARTAIVVLLVICLFDTTAGQTKVRLKFDGHFYRPKKERDAARVDLSEHGDFGRVMGNSYKLKSDLPDGEYTIYVNNRLHRRCTLKNSLPEGRWTTYSLGRPIEHQHFAGGQLHGPLEQLYPTGQVLSHTLFHHNKHFVRTTYFKTGNISSREFFIEGHLVRKEQFDKEGQVTHVDNECGAAFYGYTRSGACEPSPKLNGNCTLMYRRINPVLPLLEGSFEVEYRDNSVLHWKFLDAQQALVMEERQMEYE